LESGAFLLGTVRGKVRRIEHFLFYDDIDANCFANGIVEFDGGKFGLVWQECRDLELTVVADVHVHPGSFGQSASDRHNPMIPEVGHLALIIPHFAARARLPGSIGIYEYLGGRRWRDHSAKGQQFLHIGWWRR
jgi:proteasome lid subunit RPN8/RPN11